MKKLVVLFIIFIEPLDIFSQIDMELNNGQQNQKDFLSYSSDSFRIEKINLNYEVDYSNTTIDFHRTEFINRYKTKYLKNEYFEFGMTIGTPGGININCGYIYKKFGLRFNIGTIPEIEIYGHQLKILYNLINGEMVELGFSFGYGYNYVRAWPFGHFERKHLGLYSHLNLSGLFIEYGRGYNIQNLSNYKHLFQIGYIYRFNDKYQFHQIYKYFKCWSFY